MTNISSSTPPTTSEKFQNKLNATKNFGAALVEVFSDLVHLEIVTWVAEAGDCEHKTGNRLRTNINLIDGDIENEFGVSFLNDPAYFDLRSFHETQVQKGADTIANNLQTLVSIGQKVTDLLNNKPTVKPSTPEANTLLAGDSIDLDLNRMRLRNAG
ncbi:MAG: hypothetical protein AUK48_14340 [Oscillatoriales cyanobacterium CG2_30_44_21]|nr:MAG: hypothetical protein AUK48_14340 [Oscillatoriales cyanobacterium CG2_30_44_21]